MLNKKNIFIKYMPYPLQFTMGSGAPAQAPTQAPTQALTRLNMRPNNNVMSNLMKLCAQSTGCRSCGGK